VAFVGSVVAVGVTIADRDYQLRGYEQAAHSYPLPYRLPRLGFNAELLQYDTDELRQHLSWMEEAHVNWVRQFVYWQDIEVETGTL
jgi:tRNA(His) 5'-end guanylyltransferase